MKRAITLLMAAAMLGCVAGCAEEAPSGVPPTPDGETPSGRYTTAWNEDLPILTFAEAAENVDWIDATDMNNEAKLLLSSLKAAVNSVQPRIYSVERNDCANWLADFGYSEENLTEYTDVFALTEKYKSEFAGAVVYDPQVPDTINLASSYAGLYEGTIVCSPMVLAVLEARGVKPEVLMDFRGLFQGKYEVYEWMYENLWGDLSHKIVSCINYETPGYVRDYAIAAKSAIFWLSTSNSDDVTILRKSFRDMTAGESAFMGWFPEGDESSFVSLCSEYGILTYPSDYSENLTFLSGAITPAAARLAAVPEKTESKVYVAFIVSDGDNLQYHQHEMRTWWDLHNNGVPDFPLTWTFNPSAYVIQPAIMDFYFKNAGDMNCFMTGPSGLTYNYPRTWQNSAAREKLFELTNKYCKLSGITVVNNWMESSGGYAALTQEEQNTFGSYYTDLLAVYDQVSLGGAVNANGLLIDSLTVNYSQVGEGSTGFIAAIADAINTLKATGNVQFVTLQGNPWDGNMYKNFRTTYNTFASEAKVEFVRMDTLAMLQRLSLGMSATR